MQKRNLFCSVITLKAQLMQQIASRFDVDEIRVFEPSLNDIFVEYTEDPEEAAV